jgi:hypothetical protein
MVVIITTLQIINNDAYIFLPVNIVVIIITLIVGDSGCTIGL